MLELQSSLPSSRLGTMLGPDFGNMMEWVLMELNEPQTGDHSHARDCPHEHHFVERPSMVLNS